MEMQTDVSQAAKHAALNLPELSAEERAILESLTPAELEALIAVTKQFDKAKALSETWQMFCF